MKIRIAKIDDIQRIDCIYNQAIAAGQKTADLSPWTKDKRIQWFNEHDSSVSPLYVYEVNNLVVGYATISPYRCGREALKQTAEVSIYIDNEYQNRGIGQMLLQYLEEDSKRIEIKTLFAIIIDSNERSIRMMERNGYEKWGHLPRIASFNGIEVGHVYYGKRINE